MKQTLINSSTFLFVFIIVSAKLSFAGQFAYIFGKYDIVKLNTLTDEYAPISSLEKSYEGIAFPGFGFGAISDRLAVVDVENKEIISAKVSEENVAGLEICKIENKNNCRFENFPNINKNQDFLGALILFPKVGDNFYVFFDHFIDDENTNIEKYCFDKKTKKFLKNIDFDINSTFDRFWFSDDQSIIYYYDERNERLKILGSSKLNEISELDMLKIFSNKTKLRDIVDIRGGVILAGENLKEGNKNNFSYFTYNLNTNEKSKIFNIDFDEGQAFLVRGGKILITRPANIATLKETKSYGSHVFYLYNSSGELINRTSIVNERDGEIIMISPDGRKAYFSLYPKEDNENDELYEINTETLVIKKIIEISDINGMAFFNEQ